MRLASVRELKQAVHASLGRRRSRGAGAVVRVPGIAMGVAAGRRKNDYRLAVRVLARGAATDALVTAIRQRAVGEVDVRPIDSTRFLAHKQWNHRKVRPLQPGLAIGTRLDGRVVFHREATGTLGAFVTTGAGDTALLSCSHVLTWFGEGDLKRDVLQPAAADAIGDAFHHVADVTAFTALTTGTIVSADAGIATLKGRLGDVDATLLRGLVRGRDRRLVGTRTDPQPGDRVFKLGAATDATCGTISAVELDGVGFMNPDDERIEFASSIMIDQEPGVPFADVGDSGSLVVDDECRAVGLLFGSWTEGEASGGVANPIQDVLDAVSSTLLVD